jgi:hypothetical protein
MRQLRKKNIRREVFSASSERARRSDWISFETTSQSCIRRHREKSTQSRRIICASLTKNNRWSHSSRLAHKQMMLRSKTHSMNSLSWVWISTKSLINFLLYRLSSTSVITFKIRQRYHRRSFDDYSTLCKWTILKTTSMLWRFCATNSSRHRE